MVVEVRACLWPNAQTVLDAARRELIKRRLGEVLAVVPESNCMKCTVLLWRSAGAVHCALASTLPMSGRVADVHAHVKMSALVKTNFFEKDVHAWNVLVHIVHIWLEW